MRKAAVALAGLTLLTLSCGRSGFDPFPDAQEAPGWTKGRVRTFDAARLWEYVDGDAERYLQAGIERTLTAQYLYQGKVEAVVDVHQMREPAGARRIFQSESEVGSRPAEVGEAGRSYGTSLTFYRGRCFVRLIAYQDSPQVREALTALAAAVDGRIRRAPR